MVEGTHPTEIVTPAEAHGQTEALQEASRFTVLPGSLQLSSSSELVLPSQRKIDRRVFTKGLLGAGLGGIAYLHGSRSIDAESSNPLLNLPPVEPTPAAREWMDNTDFESQIATISKDTETVKKTKVSTIRKMTNGIRTELPLALKLGATPPELTPDIEKTYYTNPPQERRYYLVNASGEAQSDFFDIGLLSYMQGPPLSDNSTFGLNIENMMIGVSVHDYDSEKGHLRVLLGHIGGVAGPHRNRNWTSTGYLGYIADDKSIPSPVSSIIDWESESDNIYPYRNVTGGVAPKQFQDTINHLIDVKGRGLVSFQAGFSLDLNETYPLIKKSLDDMNGIPDFSSMDFLLENAKYTEEFYKWLQWNTLQAAIADNSHHSVLLSVGPEGKRTQEITDIFPDIMNPDSEPKIATPSEYLRSEKKILTRDDIVRLPQLIPLRVAPSLTGVSLFN